MLSLSIVSHRQAGMVTELLGDIQANVRLPHVVHVTINVPEESKINREVFQFPLHIVHNASARGFGANHNAAFRSCQTPFFCILNPDVRLPTDPFPALLETMRARPDVAVAAPIIRTPQGEVEISARRFPTPAFIARKALLGPPATPDYPIGDRLASPDWVGGMFMLVRTDAFRSVGGFDERYFMYYEDVDLCARMRTAGYEVVRDSGAWAVHAARRDSHRRPRYLFWHLRSMLRFWRSPAYRAMRRRRDSSNPQTKKVNTPG